MKPWENNIRKVVPYIPGEQPTGNNIVKLNTNECPYPPSPKVAEAIQKTNTEHLRLYPDPDAAALTNAIAKYYQVDANCVFVGVGSDDVLGMAFLTFFNSDLPIVFPDITYSFYDVWADLFQIKYKTMPLTEDFKIRLEDYKEKNGGVIFPNPNAPTALDMPIEQIEEIVKNNQDVIVIVDEAYIDFGGTSAVELTEKYENLLVVQTFSKSRAMAGMRIGFAIGHEDLIAAMKAVKFSYNSYTMNQTAIEAGIAAIEDDTYFKSLINKVVHTREEAKKRLKALGFEVSDSKANFVFVKHSKKQAEEIFEALKKKKIYVRYFKKPRIDNYLRITIGTDEQMERLYGALEEMLL